MNEVELIRALEAEGWVIAKHRAHCVELHRNGRWIEVWDNGDAAFGVNDYRAFLGTYLQVAQRYCGPKWAREAVKGRIDRALESGDITEMRVLLRMFRDDLQGV
jgi:hypothetical protein